MPRTTAVAASVFADVHAENDIADIADIADSADSAAGAGNDVEEEIGHAEVVGAASACAESVGAETGPENPQSVDLSGIRIVDLTDQQLLHGLRAQSEAHFAELYQRYFQRIYNFVYARMRNHAESEEVVQETFLAVFRSFENYRGQSSLLSWIYGIAKNTTNNTLRKAKSQHERIDLADEDDLVPRPSIGVGAPDEQLDLYRFGDQLTQRLDQLADWQAEILEMRHFDNLSIPEISKRTQRSSDAVRSSLYRVKRMFLDAAAASGSPVPNFGERR